MKLKMYSGRLDIDHIKWYTKFAKKKKTSRDALIRQAMFEFIHKNKQ